MSSCGLTGDGQDSWPDFLSLRYADAYRVAYPRRRIEAVDVGNGAVAVFDCADRVARSVLPTIPWIGSCDTPILASLLRRLAVECLWFPLMCQDRRESMALATVDGVVVYERAPSPTIDWGDRGAGLWARACARAGSQAERRRRMFERQRLSVRRIVDPAEARAVVASVEARSWKAQCAQDMVSRDQLCLYNVLLDSRILRATVVCDGERAVAYRLDAKDEATLFCVKWSYDEAYAKVSPGFYLIARDLAEQYAAWDVAMIDLFGGPDPLKLAVMTGARARIDVAWPANTLAAALGSEGQARDRAVAASVQQGRGLRRLYLKTTSS
jgi:hypothetical protein